MTIPTSWLLLGEDPEVLITDSEDVIEDKPKWPRLVSVLITKLSSLIPTDSKSLSLAISKS
jgi:hypothetical protein